MPSRQLSRIPGLGGGGWPACQEQRDGTAGMGWGLGVAFVSGALGWGGGNLALVHGRGWHHLRPGPLRASAQAVLQLPRHASVPLFSNKVAERPGS